MAEHKSWFQCQTLLRPKYKPDIGTHFEEPQGNMWRHPRKDAQESVGRSWQTATAIASPNDPLWPRDPFWTQREGTFRGVVWDSGRGFPEVDENTARAKTSRLGSNEREGWRSLLYHPTPLNWRTCRWILSATYCHLRPIFIQLTVTHFLRALQ